MKEVPPIDEQALRKRVERQVRAQMLAAKTFEERHKRALEKRLQFELARIETVVELSDAQRRRLELGIKGAVKQDRKLTMGPSVQELLDSVGFNVRYGKRALQSGQIRGPQLVQWSPLWRKTIDRTLDEDQLAKFRAEEAARLEHRVNTLVATMVYRIDASVALSEAQRIDLAELLRIEFKDEIERTVNYSEYIAYHYVRQLVQSDSEAVHKFFDEDQLEALRGAHQNFSNFGPAEAGNMLQGRGAGLF